MEKKNTDYSNSAVNLKNPVELEIALQAYIGLTKKIKEVEDKISECVPQELKDTLSSLQTQLSACTEGIKTDIDNLGSYQNLTLGVYAVKQRKVSKSYDAGIFEKVYPQFSPAIIIKAVDAVKLGGLIKGGLIKEDDLKTNGVVSEKESFTYIIKV